MVRAFFVAALVWGAAHASAFARSPAIEDILALRDIGGFRSGLALSPDGSEVAVFERETLLDENAYRFQLVVTSLASGRGRVIADAGGAILRSATGRFSGAIDDRTPVWSPHGDWIAYLSENEGAVELWRVRADGRRRQRLIADGRNVLAFAFLGEDEIVFTSAAPRADAAAQAARQALLGFVVDERFEPYYSLRPYPDLRLGQTTRVLDLRTGALRDAADSERQALNPAARADAPLGAIAYDAETELRAWIAPRTPGDRAARPVLGLYAAYGQAPARLCEHDACGGRLMGAWIKDSAHIVFLRNEGFGLAESGLYVWALETDTVHLLRRGDELLLGCDDAETVLVCLYETPAAPRRLVAIDLERGALQVLRDPNPQWRDFSITRIERLEVRDSYGAEGYAHLVWPANYVADRPYPLVIVQYRSRGFLRGGVGGEYPIHALAGRGYFVLSVERTERLDLESRLSANDVQIATELDGSELAMKQSQIEALLDLLEARQLIDPSRIGITGFSDGAETAYRMATHSARIAAIVVSTPPTDPISWPLISESFRREQRNDGMTGPYPDAPEPWASWWRANSTVLAAEAIEAPMLMNFSDNEALLGFPLAARLTELSRAQEMFIYPGEYHVKWQPRHILEAQRRALDWFDFWLRGIEREDANDPGRIARWRDLQALHAAAAP